MKHTFLLSSMVLFSLVTVFSCNKNDEASGEKTDKTYIIISDLHFGDPRSFEQGYSKNAGMKDTLTAFLDYLKTDNTWDELIVAGDMLDEWIALPSAVTLANSKGEPVSEAEYFQILVETNKDVFEKFMELRNSGRKLVYIPGNHDMQTTSEDFNKYLSGIFEQARTSGVIGMGEYRPDDEIFIEHGHRYDINNAPYIGKAGVDDIPEGSMLPPGFFISKLMIGSKLKNIGTKSYLPTDEITYDFMWNVIGQVYGTDSIATYTDGMTLKYGFNDYAFSTSKLFKDIDDFEEKNDGWIARCRRLGARFVPSVTISILSGLLYDFCDQMGLQVLTDTDFTPHILVWGHSHSPKLMTSLRKGTSEKVIYLNTGCWVDGKNAGSDCTSTFGKVTKTKNGNYEASLCRFDIGSDGKGFTTVMGTEKLYGSESEE